MEIETLLNIYKNANASTSTITDYLKTYKKYVNIRISNNKIVNVISTLDASGNAKRKQETGNTSYIETLANGNAKKIANNKYAIDSTLYAIDGNIETLVNTLKKQKR